MNTLTVLPIVALTALLDTLEAQDVSIVCHPDDTTCLAIYNSIDWQNLNEMPEDCADAAVLLGKLIRLSDLLTIRQ